MTKREKRNARRIAERDALPYVILDPGTTDRAALQTLREKGILK